MSLPRLVLAACLGLSGLLAPSLAFATTTCTANMTDVAFGDIDAQGGTTKVTATLEYDCETSTSFSLASDASVRMCFGIGAGSGAGSSVNQRYMSSPAGDVVRFRLARDPAATSNWGNAPGTWGEAHLVYPLSGRLFSRQGRGSGRMTVYAEVPAQTNLAAGSYTSAFNDTRMVYRYRETAIIGSEPSSCTSGGDTGVDAIFPFTARATVPGSCTINGATDLNFGSLLSTSTGLLEQTSRINLTCTRRTAWQVGLDNGRNFDGTSRRLRNGSAYIRYELNRSAGWNRWGDTLNVDTITGTGTGNTQSLTVHGRITNQPLTRAGRYSDTIKVTVTY
jgi:spore coat protein U-like protein